MARRVKDDSAEYLDISSLVLDMLKHHKKFNEQHAEKCDELIEKRTRALQFNMNKFGSYNDREKEQELSV